MQAIFHLLSIYQLIPRQSKCAITNLKAFHCSHETNQKYLIVSGGTLTTCQSAFSETMRRTALPFPTSRA